MPPEDRTLAFLVEIDEGLHPDLIGQLWCALGAFRHVCLVRKLDETELLEIEEVHNAHVERRIKRRLGSDPE